MATIQEKLAGSLKILQRLQNENGFAIVKSSKLTRIHLERLVANGFLQEVMKGWYISSRPDSTPGDTTNWYTSYWYFITEYSNSRFGKDWCLTPDQSLSLHSGNWIVPTQVIIRSPKGSNNVTELIHNTSLLDIKASLANPIYIESRFGLNLYSLPEALIECSPDFFRLDSITARTCLALIPDASDVLRILLEKGQTIKAGRLAGAFRNIGHEIVADEIVGTMKSLGYDIREEDPFEDKTSISYSRITSPYVARIKLMWSKMREVVMANFPKTENVHADIEACMKDIEAQYKLDAYHSLSLEGYRVTDTLIEKVKRGNWQPDVNTSDAEQKNAMAARGYFQAFEAVKNSIKRILEGGNVGEVVEDSHRTWYRELFAPSVVAGILKPTDLAGYRTGQVYIRGSLHTPLNPEAVRDAMPILFNLLKEEPDARVRAILGHFIFVYIHPYMDGNGRMGRFLMNTMLISGGYNWTIVPVERRQEYMKALEKGSVEGNITDFTLFIASLLKQ
ncbi:Fic family protein [Massilibacteroides sp.]|uniref:Fic family protein n=1 Tax=Massilibacteroides sp. TaxID=2034766 RepID=UPI00262B6EDA|nr:Fic family protein [Massilibacteroides sp.]MDD4516809.1 Fic family protein [Massilibacteroides sp.]